MLYLTQRRGEAEFAEVIPLLEYVFVFTNWFQPRILGLTLHSTFYTLHSSVTLHRLVLVFHGGECVLSEEV